MSKAWGGVGAWAADAEQADAEEAASAAARDSALSASFPTLKDAATKPKKTKMTLADNAAGTGGGPARFESSTKLTPEEMQRLPTGPKERSAEEYGRMGGFRSYGPRRDDYDGQWGGGGGGGDRRSYGGFDDDRRGAPPSRSSDFDMQPSRADEVDNWAAAKKTMGFSDSSRYDRGDRYSSLGSGGGGGSSYVGAGGGFSRADEVDNWGSAKRTLPSRPGFGSGFMDSGEGARERPKLVLDKRRVDSGGAPAEPTVKSSKPSPFGEARPREEILAEKGLDWRKLDTDRETKRTSRPPSAQSSRPSSAHSNRPESPGVVGLEAAQRTRPKINPFGDAKPREDVLREHGIDWRKKDLELERRSVDRQDTAEEKELKQKIASLWELSKYSDAEANGESADKTAMQEEINQLEMALEVLARDLDSKLKLRPRTADRPGSGRGRMSGFPDRSLSQSGLSDDARSIEFSDRPLSRGTGDAWARAEDRRMYPGGSGSGKDTGYQDFGRSRPRHRWPAIDGVG